jgi:hypothetical protein
MSQGLGHRPYQLRGVIAERPQVQVRTVAAQLIPHAVDPGRGDIVRPALQGLGREENGDLEPVSVRRRLGLTGRRLMYAIVSSHKASCRGNDG